MNVKNVVMEDMVLQANKGLDMSQKVLKVQPNDNVIVALQDLPKGEQVYYNGTEYIVQDDIPAKHKFFEHDMYCTTWNTKEFILHP